MNREVQVANTQDLKPGECKMVEVDGCEIALCNVDGKFHAIDNTCPHQGGPLGEGIMEGKEVVCPWHGWRFDVTTGLCATIPTLNNKVFECTVEGDEVRVKVD
ncbi:Rieske 2Fe-2S domain-containing protein [bacterium]|nr:Rieske 2Fe-2S domain-containing protein [bacterium]